MESYCFCDNGPPRIVTVRDGRVTAVRDEETGVPLPASALDQFLSIEQMFDLALDENVAHATGEFDARLGTPRELYIDHWAGIADDEISYLVGWVRRL